MTHITPPGEARARPETPRGDRYVIHVDGNTRKDRLAITWCPGYAGVDFFPKSRRQKELSFFHWARSCGVHRHRWLLGTPASTWLTCWPQPAQDAFSQRGQVTRRHMGMSIPQGVSSRLAVLPRSRRRASGTRIP